MNRQQQRVPPLDASDADWEIVSEDDGRQSPSAPAFEEFDRFSQSEILQSVLSSPAQEPVFVPDEHLTTHLIHNGNISRSMHTLQPSRSEEQPAAARRLAADRLLSRSVMAEEEAFRLGPVARAAAAAAERGKEATPASKAGGSTQGQLSTKLKSLTVTTSPEGGRGGNWSRVKSPASPAQHPQQQHEELPALCLGRGAVEMARQDSRTQWAHEQRTQQEEATDVCWTMAKYALLFGGSLYIGNNLQKRLTSNSA